MGWNAVCTCKHCTIRGQQWASSPQELELQVFVSDLCECWKLNLALVIGISWEGVQVPYCWRKYISQSERFEIQKHPAPSVCLVGDGGSQLPVGDTKVPAPSWCICPLHALSSQPCPPLTTMIPCPNGLFPL